MTSYCGCLQNPCRTVRNPGVADSIPHQEARISTLASLRGTKGFSDSATIRGSEVTDGVERCGLAPTCRFRLDPSLVRFVGGSQLYGGVLFLGGGPFYFGWFLQEAKRTPTMWFPYFGQESAPFSWFYISPGKSEWNCVSFC